VRASYDAEHVRFQPSWALNTFLDNSALIPDLSSPES
jgi:hypothetical protein